MNTFQRNFSLLQQRDPALAERVRSGPEDVSATLKPTAAGYPTLIVQAQGKAIALHHPNDPAGQSQLFLASIQNWKKARNIAIIGGGLGYVPLLVHQSQPRLQHLFVLEPSLTVFRAALQALDWSPLLSDSRVCWVVGSEPNAIHAALMGSVVDLVANPLIAQEIPSVTAAFPQWAQSAKQQIIEVMQFGQSGMFTKFKDGPLTLGNLFQNLEDIAASPGLNLLENSLKGVPAIIVAAGPSLKKNIDTIQQAGDDFLIIATDTAFELMLKRGIVPHMVVTVDPTQLNIKHFPREQYGRESLLLFDPEARPEIVRKFTRCLTFMTDKHPFFRWLDERVGGKGIVQKGNMVSQAGIYAAHYLGCDPLIVMGQDLALDPETGHTHIPDTAYCRQGKYLDGDRQHIDIPVPVGEAQMTRENLFWVEGIDGNPVPTVQNFLVYLRMMERDIRDLNLRLIDATEGGAKIRGSQIMSLAEAIQQNRKSAVCVSKILQVAENKKDQKTNAQGDLLKQTLRRILEERVALSQEGIKKLEQAGMIPRETLEKMIQSYRERIFADPSAEYLVEYGAPSELFEFMKLGPATLSEEEERQWTQKRLKLLLEASPQAAERLMKYLG